MASAVADEEEVSEDEEAGPGMDFGMAVGVVLVLVTVWAFFLGPRHMFELGFGGGPMILEVRDVGNLGPIPYVSGATLILGVLSGVGYPAYADDPESEYQIDVALGLMAPTVVAVGLLVGVMLFFPVIHYVLAGDLITATFFLIVMAVVVAIALSAWIVLAALFLVGTIYLAIPALVGVYGGSFLARGLGAARP